MVVKTLKSKFLRFSKFLKVQSTAVEIYEKPYVIFEQARPTRGGHATNRSVNCKKITFLNFLSEISYLYYM